MNLADIQPAVWSLSAEAIRPSFNLSRDSQSSQPDGRSSGLPGLRTPWGCPQSPWRQKSACSIPDPKQSRGLHPQCCFLSFCLHPALYQLSVVSHRSAIQQTTKCCGLRMLFLLWGIFILAGLTHVSVVSWQTRCGLDSLTCLEPLLRHLR